MARDRPRVVGPTGEILTLRNLPPPETMRWVPRRKAELVVAVRGGLLSLSEVCERYGLTREEFLGWQDTMERHGLTGLRVTKPRGTSAPGR
jgi:hypothetical protein